MNRKLTKSARRRPDTAKPGPKSNKSDRRRNAIVEALRRSIAKDGYAGTSLSDLARSAGMSVSHLLYYFPTKDAILENLCSEISQRLIAKVNQSRKEPPLERIAQLPADLFADDKSADQDIAIMLDLVAQSAHNRRIRTHRMACDRHMAESLTDLFKQVPRRAGIAPEKAAAVTAAVWMGLATRTQYDKKMDKDLAAELFRSVLMCLGGIDDLNAKPKAKAKRQA